MTNTDSLIEAVKDLEDAVDQYAAAVYINVTNPDAGDTLVSVFGQMVTEACTAVALAMVDADVNGTKLVAIVPENLKPGAAEAEIAALHGSAKLITEARCARCAGTGQFITYVENGVPKGPGGPCYRCNGKGVQTVADHRRNYGHDMNFVPSY